MDDKDRKIVEPEVEIEEEHAVDVDMCAPGRPLPSADEVLRWSSGTRQLTIRALLFGCVIGGAMGMSNIYMGLKAGWTEGGSIISAVLAFALAKGLSPIFRSKFTILENNISQTTGSAAGCMASSAGLVSAIPALAMLGVKLSYWELTFWAVGVSLLGVFFVIPLRQQMVVREKLRFPTGTATAACIKAMHAAGGEALKKAHALIYMGLFSAAFTWLRDAKASWMPFNIPHNIYFPGSIVGYACKSLTLGLNMSPMMIGAGLLIGPRVGTSLMVGAMVCWGVIAPILLKSGIVETLSYRELMRWTLWPGVALMVSTGITAMLMQWKSIVRTFSTIEHAAHEGGHREGKDQIGFGLWLFGLICAAALAVAVANRVFDIPVWMSLIAIAMSGVLATIAVRCGGETDINPVGGMGKVTQLVFGAIAPGNMTTNLMAAAVTAAGASQSGDMMHDLKAGYILGASPKKQLFAQIVGVVAGGFIVVPIYFIVTKAYALGGEGLPAPAAIAWSAMAKVLAKGISSIPVTAAYGAAVGVALGVALTLAGRTRCKGYLPSGIGLGLAFVVPAYYCVSIFLGSMVLVYLNWRHHVFSERYSTSIAAGGIAGEGIMGVAIATLLVVGVMG